MVMALYRVRVLEWDQTRDRFVANLTSVYATSRGAKEITTDSLLSAVYPQRRRRLTIDPDLGAGGDWRNLRDVLKGKRTP